MKKIFSADHDAQTLEAIRAPDPGEAGAPLLAALAEAVVRFDAEGRVRYLNAAAERLTGWPLDQARGRRLIEIYPEAVAGGRWLDGGRLAALPSVTDLPDLGEAPAAGRQGEASAPRRLTRPDGTVVWLRESWVPLVDGRGGWLVLDDQTRRRQLEQRLEWQVLHDPITGLRNRRGFEDSLERAIEEALVLGCSHACGFLELDDLELVHDAFGRPAGDDLLCQVSQLLAGHLAETDVLARLAPERFGLLIRHLDPAELERRSADLRRLLAEARFSWQGESFEIGTSLGLVPIDASTGTLMEVLGAADAALCRAQESLGETHRFNPDDSRDIRLAEHYGEMRWLGRIDRALRGGRFRLYRQPIVETAMPRVADAPLHEVLLRMIDEDGHVVAPGAFIPAAERFQLITSIDRWVVRRALEHLAGENGAGAPRALTLNLSGQSITDASFLDFVLAEVAASGLDPWRLCFEITETAAVSNLERARRFMTRLRDLGCRFILDDFGAGMSSFAYLKSLPVDYLKIDGGFVREMLDDPIQHAIVCSIHQVGSVMGIRTIAEMVESRAQLEAAHEIGIDCVQGFFVRHPEPWGETA